MILVTGATGNIGGEVLRQCLSIQQADEIVVRATVRNPAKATALTDKGIQVVQADFSDISSMREALNGIDRFFSQFPKTLPNLK